MIVISFTFDLTLVLFYLKQYRFIITVYLTTFLIT